MTPLQKLQTEADELTSEVLRKAFSDSARAAAAESRAASQSRNHHSGRAAQARAQGDVANAQIHEGIAATYQKAIDAYRKGDHEMGNQHFDDAEEAAEHQHDQEASGRAYGL